MAIFDCEGFDHYSIDNLSLIRPYTGGTFTLESERIDGQSLGINPGVPGMILAIEYADQVAIGFGFKYQTAGYNREVVRFHDSSFATYSTLSLMSTKNFQFIRRVTSLNPLGSHILHPNIWYYVECFFQHSNSTTKHCIVMINGEMDLVLPLGTDTNYFGSNYLRAIELRANNNAGDHFFDDLYIASDSGYFSGDIHVSYVTPSGTGSQSDWIGSDLDSTDNYELINAVPYDSGTFIASSGINELDLYTLSPFLYTPEQIDLVTLYSIARKDLSGTRKLQNVVRIDSNNYYGSGISVTQQDMYISYALTDNPNTGSGWLVSDFENLEIGNNIFV